MSVADVLGESLIRVAGDVCRDFERASRLEWLETNHTGAFAMGTVAGVNTRRYHALLTAALDPPSDRVAILSRLEETLTAEDRRYELSTVQYPGVIQPRGFELLEEFRADPCPTWFYKAGGILLQKSICLRDGLQSVLIRYQANAPCRLTVRLLVSFRDYHSLSSRNDWLNQKVEAIDGQFSFHPYPELPAVRVRHSADSFLHDGLWFYNNEYLRDWERGLTFREDLYSPGSLSFNMCPGQSAWLLASLDFSSAREEPEMFSFASAFAAEIDARTSESSSSPAGFPKILRRALDQFRVIRSDKKPSLLAGYPWFTDWSRDTLISLPGLMAAGFPPSEIKAILLMLLAERSQGLLPNRFSDRHSTPEYNAVDASLWFFIAAQDFLSRSPDPAFLSSVLYPAARDILAWYQHGTLFGIGVDPLDHLLSAGAPGLQLTWMDAKVGDYVVTPRVGKPVEINALWYNALKISAAWATMLGLPRDSIELDTEAAAVLASFQTHFWNSQRQCLFDVVAPGGNDGSIRPNQIFAASLPYALLDPQRARSMLHVVNQNLLTPLGLRTLEPGHPGYRPRFEGDMAARDSAYHQGTVWPWLMGPYVSAYLYAFGRTEASLSICGGLLAGLEQQLFACCLGSLSEVYDAEPPQRPAGCPAQLWSVAQLILAAEVLRLAQI
jgi:predicted glycogen debranching enzyme